MIEIPCKVGYIERFKINPSLFNDEKMLYAIFNSQQCINSFKPQENLKQK